jgi:CheY-like chemotaxis protein
LHIAPRALVAGSSRCRSRVGTGGGEAPAEQGDEDLTALEGHPAADRRHRILLVEDSRDVAEGMALLLELEGHEVVIAADGEEGLAAADRMEPDVVLLDIGLPRLDGWEVARRLRQRWPKGDLLLVAITGYGQERDRARSEQVGIDRHLVKPVSLEEVRRVLAAFQGPSQRA